MISKRLSKVGFYPPSPQGGLYKLLYFNKSPLGDLGVKKQNRGF